MGKISTYLATHRKAAAGAILGALTAAAGALYGGATWQVIAVSALAATLGVGAVPNAAKPSAGSS